MNSIGYFVFSVILQSQWIITTSESFEGKRLEKTSSHPTYHEPKNETDSVFVSPLMPSYETIIYPSSEDHINHLYSNDFQTPNLPILSTFINLSSLQIPIVQSLQVKETNNRKLSTKITQVPSSYLYSYHLQDQSSILQEDSSQMDYLKHSIENFSPTRVSEDISREIQVSNNLDDFQRKENPPHAESLILTKPSASFIPISKVISTINPTFKIRSFAPEVEFSGHILASSYIVLSETVKPPMDKASEISSLHGSQLPDPTKTETDKIIDRSDNSESTTKTNLNISHEIINDSNRNKSSRNEDPQFGDILSGIIHLLAGNVQRPSPNNFQTNHKSQNRPFPSTRINNRGPLSSGMLSRTVVVFSQPKNPGIHPTKPHRPGQFIPSTTNGPKLTRPTNKQSLRTEIREKQPSNAPSHHFHHSNGNTLRNVNAPPHFVGEIFTHQGEPSAPKVQFTNHPDNFKIGSSQNTKIKDDQTYPHFIFSDGLGSSVIVMVSTALSQPIKVTPTSVKLNAASSRTNTFEVLQDTSSPDKNEKIQKLRNKITSPFTRQTESKDSGGSFKTSNRHKTTDISISHSPTIDVPFGPITDWVPVFERPAMKFKPVPGNKSKFDDEVSIITKPIIFDITVGNSLNKMPLPTRTSDIDTTKYLPTNAQVPQSKTSSSYEISNKPNRLETIISNSVSQLLSLQENYLVLSSTIITSSESNLISPEIIPPLSVAETTPSLPNDIAKETLFLSSFIRTRTETVNTISSKIKNPLEKTRDSFANYEVVPNSQSATSLVSTKTSGPMYSEIGRPIVIPVDIEEVRPYVGAVNPINPDNARPNYPPDLLPVPPYQVTRAGVVGNDHFRSVTDLSTAQFKTTRTPIIRSPPRLRPNTIRIDTCIVGDDSTCDVKFNETCKTEHGISSCHCRPGYSRTYSRGPCIPTVAVRISLKLDKFGTRKISFSPKYRDKNSEDYRIMEFEVKQALSTLFGKTAFSRNFFGMTVNMFHSIGGKLVANCTIFLEEKESTRAQSVRIRLRQEIGEAIKRKNQNIGDSRLFVEGPMSPITNIEDVNECSDIDLNDCSPDGICFNIFGTFLCKCKPGYVDPFIHDERLSGRRCLACSSEYCNYHGQCYVEQEQKLCKCQGNYIGSRCEIDGEVLGVALGASLAAIIIILLTLACLCIWNRKWKKQQQKAEVLSARSYNSNQTFTYLSNMLNGNPNAYNLTMEDRMRWAHISDVVKSTSGNPESPYNGTHIDPSAFPTLRYPHSNDEEPNWYDYRTRPRSKILAHPTNSSSASYYEMEPPSRSIYASSGYPSKRYQSSSGMSRY